MTYCYIALGSYAIKVMIRMIRQRSACHGQTKYCKTGRCMVKAGNEAKDALRWMTKVAI